MHKQIARSQFGQAPFGVLVRAVLKKSANLNFSVVYRGKSREIQKIRQNENFEISNSKKNHDEKIFFDRIFFKPQVLYQSCPTRPTTSPNSNS